MLSILLRQLSRGFFPSFVSGIMHPLLCGGHLLHPKLFIICQCLSTSPCFCLALLDLALSLSKPYGLQTHLSSFKYHSPPIHVRIEGVQEGVPQYEAIFTQVGEKKLHLHHLSLILDFDPTVIFNLPLPVFGAVYIVHC